MITFLHSAHSAYSPELLLDYFHLLYHWPINIVEGLSTHHQNMLFDSESNVSREECCNLQWFMKLWMYSCPKKGSLCTIYTHHHHPTTTQFLHKRKGRPATNSITTQIRGTQTLCLLWQSTARNAICLCLLQNLNAKEASPKLKIKEQMMMKLWTFTSNFFG